MKKTFMIKQLSGQLLTLFTAGALVSHMLSSSCAAHAFAKSESIVPCSSCVSLDSYMSSEIPVATAGSFKPADGLMLCRFR